MEPTQNTWLSQGLVEIGKETLGLAYDLHEHILWLFDKFIIKEDRYADLVTKFSNRIEDIRSAHNHGGQLDR